MSAVVTAQENRSWFLNRLIWCIVSRIDITSDDKIFNSAEKFSFNFILK